MSESTMDVTQRPWTLYSFLIHLCENNIVYFENDRSKRGQRLHASFIELREHVSAVTPVVDHMLDVASEFDFDTDTPANGYRSFIAVIDACVTQAVCVSEEICEQRDSYLFKKTVFTRKIESCRHLMASLKVCLQQLTSLLAQSTEGDLFSDEEHSVEFLKLAETINMIPFYGSLLGFQFCKSMQKHMRHVSIGMASYSKCFKSNRNMLIKAAILIWSGGRYASNTEERAKKLAYVSRFATVEFVKSFWFSSERSLAYRATSFIGPPIAVNKIFTIPTEPLEHITEDNQRIPIPIPASYFGPAPISAHLYSSIKRQGIEKNSSDAVAPMSRYLLFHCHGGGFIAQSPRSHEVYLREWACKLDMPIFSVDYSLAPRAPFPRPLEEVLYAYCWALQNCHMLGSTAEHIVFAGDSAGANLCLSLALKCISLNLPAPKGLFLAYMPVLISVAPSPSRLLTFMDPMLPYGFLIACLKAYACPANEINNDDEKISSNGVEKAVIKTDFFINQTQTNGTAADCKSEIIHDAESKPLPNNNQLNTNGDQTSQNLPQEMESLDKDLVALRDPFLSPWLATDEVLKKLPPISILSTQFDPCLDDCVMFSRRLKQLGNKITFDVLEGLPHGFLYFTKMSLEAQVGSDLCLKRIKQLSGINNVNNNNAEKV